MKDSILLPQLILPDLGLQKHKNFFADLFSPQIISQPFNQLVILPECTNGFYRGFDQEPTENEDRYGESDLPCPSRFRTPPNKGQRQRPHGADCDYDEGFSEIPWKLFFVRAWGSGAIQKLPAVFTFYRGVLNIFSAEGAFFHYHLSWENM